MILRAKQMCGRIKLEGDVSEIKIAFRIPPDYPTPNWNVAPTRPVADRAF
jgi:hypothetical protein